MQFRSEAFPNNPLRQSCEFYNFKVARFRPVWRRPNTRSPIRSHGDSLCTGRPACQSGVERRAGLRTNRCSSPPLPAPTFVNSSTSNAASRPFLASLFRDHAVLQRDQPIRIWGWADPGDTVTVSIAGVNAKASAEKSGRWNATLPAIAAGGPHVLEARSESGAHQTVSDVMVGDVWLCSGQSNMELQVLRTLNSRSEIGDSANDRIRMLTVRQENSLTPLDELLTPAPWQLAGPDTVPDFSAACFYFARELQKTVNVPMGLITSAWGGSMIQAWMSEPALRAIGGYESKLELLSAKAKDSTAGTLQWGHTWEGWWRGRTSYRSGAEPWSASPAIAKNWRVAPAALGFWQRWGVPDLEKYVGILWYRTSFALSKQQAAQRATLSLGRIDDVDQTWVNGIPVGYTSGYQLDRRYDVAAGTLHAGENTLAIAALDLYAPGGVYGPAEHRVLQLGRWHVDSLEQGMAL